MFPLGRRYTSRQCFPAREASRPRFSYSTRAEWPSCRFVVTTSLPYRRILPAKETRTLDPRWFRRRDEFCERGKERWVRRRGVDGIREDGFTRRARFQVKLNMKLHDRSGSRGAFPSQEIHRIADWAEHASCLVALCGIWTLNFISRPEWIYYTARSEILMMTERRQLHLHLRVGQIRLPVI